MSIRDHVRACVIEGTLFPINPDLPSIPIIRHIYVSGPLRDWLLSGEFRAGRLHADLDLFIGGDIIHVSMTPFKAKNAYMGLLNPVGDGIWDIRSRDPRPGIRVFGGFAEKDVFIALGWYERPSLGDKDSRAYRDVIEHCKTDWRNRFHAYKPIGGDNIHDYLSNNFIVV